MKKAIIAKVELSVRVVINDDIDLDMDPEFDTAVKKRILERIKEEGDGYIRPAIKDYNDDLENPYNPEFD